MSLPVIEGTFLQASCKACRIQNTVARGTASAASPGFKVLASRATAVGMLEVAEKRHIHGFIINYICMYRMNVRIKIGSLLNNVKQCCIKEGKCAE